jgi:hypothetical protein
LKDFLGLLPVFWGYDKLIHYKNFQKLILKYQKEYKNLVSQIFFTKLCRLDQILQVYD